MTKVSQTKKVTKHEKGFMTRKFKIFKLSDVDKISIMVFIANPEINEDLKMKVNILGGRVLSSVKAEGVPRRPILKVLGFESVESFVTFSIARKEDAQNILEKIVTEFNFAKPGTGKAFIIETNGYLGGRGPLCES